MGQSNSNHIRLALFDLGNVLVHFSHEQMIEQIADAAEVESQLVQQVVFDQHLQARYEIGEIDSAEFYQRFCQETQSQVDRFTLEHAASAIFSVNREIVPLLSALTIANVPMAILSNTCHTHWEYIRRRSYNVVRMFPKHFLSFQLHAAKPSPRIFDLVIQSVEMAPHEIFFVDDRVENVDAAISCGIDAVVFRDTTALARQLRARGVDFSF